MRKIIVCLLVISLGLLLKSCNTVEPPPGDKPTLLLKLEDVSCTEAWIELTTTNLPLPATIALKKDNVGQTISLSSADTVLYVDSLLPSKTYNFQAISHSSHQSIKSNEITAATLDTTSHNFTFETFTFGEHGNSVLFDVAIIDENNIWAVGKIYMNDSLGNPDNNAYNAVHWDGSQWELKRISVIYKGGLITPFLYGIFAFSDTEIWLSAGVPIKGDGTSWTQYHLFDMGILTQNDGYLTKIWGTSSNDLYYVGTKGTIARYINGTWSRIESGTDVNLLDVWGSPDGKIVWACGETIYKTVLIKIENNMAEIVFEGTYPMPIVKNRFSDGLLSLWTNSNNFIYVLTPYNLYRCFTDTKGEGLELYPYDDYFKGAYVRIRGTAINDIVTSENKSTITHFNGISWKIYDELRNEDQYLAGLDVKGNLLVTVGEKFENTFYYKAIVIVGKK